MLLPNTLARVEAPTKTTGWIPLATLGVGKGQVTAPARSTPFLPSEGEGFEPVPIVDASRPLEQLRGMGWVLLIAGAVGVFYFLRKASK